MDGYSDTTVKLFNKNWSTAAPPTVEEGESGKEEAPLQVMEHIFILYQLTVTLME